MEACPAIKTILARSSFVLLDEFGELCRILADRLKIGYHLRDIAVSQFSIERFRMRFAYDEASAVSDAVGYAKFFSRSHDAVIRVYDDAGNVIETHEHAGDFKEW